MIVSAEYDTNTASIEIHTIINGDAVGGMTRSVIKAKLAKMRHLVVEKAISPDYLESLFPEIIKLFKPQQVKYNQGIEWKISCYLEVMDGGVPCADPCNELRSLCQPLLSACDQLFTTWYRQQHRCSRDLCAKRIMTFITRYTAFPGEEALLKHVDGAGSVDGSVVVALPMDPDSFEGHGGGLTFWDGKGQQAIDYDTRCGDIAFIDRAVWHQANPIRKGVRWAMVIFYETKEVV